MAPLLFLLLLLLPLPFAEFFIRYRGGLGEVGFAFSVAVAVVVVVSGMGSIINSLGQIKSFEIGKTIKWMERSSVRIRTILISIEW